MRLLPCLLLTAALAVQSTGAFPVAAATQNTDKMKACAARWNELKHSGRANGQTYQQFCQAFLSGPAGGSSQANTAQPRANHPPAGATARCKDGSFTVAPKGKPGACSGHGGVAQWLG